MLSRPKESKTILEMEHYKNHLPQRANDSEEALKHSSKT